MAPRKRKRHTVAAVVFPNMAPFELSVPCEVFGLDRSELVEPWYDFFVAATCDEPVETGVGFSISTPYRIDDLARADTIIIPADYKHGDPPEELLDALRTAHRRGARLLSFCTGAFVLAAAGLLDGRPATTHWMYAPTLAKRYPSVHVDPRELFVDDGDVLTSAGTAAGIDLCLHIVRTDHGNEAAGALARRLVVPPRRTGGQERYLDRSLPEEIGSDPLAEVVAWALEHLHEQFDVETLAARAYMSRRTFDRRFRSLTGSAPLQWLITQRVLQAQRLLETSDYSVDEVAGRCGFRSPVALRGHFRRQLGSSPAAYRAAYRARRPQGDKMSEPDGVVSGVQGGMGTPTTAGQGHGHGHDRAPHQESPVPIQARRTASTVGLSAEHGRDPYVGNRASLPGQRSGA